MSDSEESILSHVLCIVCGAEIPEGEAYRIHYPVPSPLEGLPTCRGGMCEIEGRAYVGSFTTLLRAYLDVKIEWTDRWGPTDFDPRFVYPARDIGDRSFDRLLRAVRFVLMRERELPLEQEWQRRERRDHDQA